MINSEVTLRRAHLLHPGDVIKKTWEGWGFDNECLVISNVPESFDYIVKTNALYIAKHTPKQMMSPLRRVLTILNLGVARIDNRIEIISMYSAKKCWVLELK